jgi:hypothetical protein
MILQKDRGCSYSIRLFGQRTGAANGEKGGKRGGKGGKIGIQQESFVRFSAVKAASRPSETDKERPQAVIGLNKGQRQPPRSIGQ